MVGGAVDGGAVVVGGGDEDATELAAGALLELHAVDATARRRNACRHRMARSLARFALAEHDGFVGRQGAAERPALAHTDA